MSIIENLIIPEAYKDIYKEKYPEQYAASFSEEDEEEEEEVIIAPEKVDSKEEKKKTTRPSFISERDKELESLDNIAPKTNVSSFPFDKKESDFSKNIGIPSTSDLIKMAALVQGGPDYVKDLEKIVAKAATNVSRLGYMLSNRDNKIDLSTLDSKSRNSVYNDAAEKLTGNFVRWNDPDVIDPETGRIQDSVTAKGLGTELGAYLYGGRFAGIKSGQSKLEMFGRATAAGEAVYQILGRPDENLFNDLRVILDVPEEDSGLADTVLDFFEAEEGDTEAVKRLKMGVEGSSIGAVLGMLGEVPRYVRRFRQAVDPTNLSKTLEDMTPEEANKYLIKYFEEAKRNVDSDDIASLRETREGLKQVQEQASTDKEEIVDFGLNIKLDVGPARASLKRLNQRYFTSRGYATPMLFRAATQSKHNQRQLITKAQNLSNRLETIFKDAGGDQKLIDKTYKLLTADLSSVFKVKPEKQVSFFAKQRKISEDLAETILDTRRAIDSISDEIANTPGFSKEVKAKIQNNIGNYVRQSYEIFENPNYKPTIEQTETAKKFLIDDYIQTSILRAEELGKEITENMLDRFTKSATKKADKQIRNWLGANDDLFDYMHQSRRVGKFHRKNPELPKELKDFLGEIKNPSDAIVISITKAARILEMQKFYNQANALGKRNYIVTDETARYNTKITNTNSILDGKYTTPEISMVLNNEEEMYRWIEESNFFKSLVGLKGFAQSMKTTYSHVTHARNIMGGYQFGLANGLVFKQLFGTGGETIANKIFDQPSIFRAGTLTLPGKLLKKNIDQKKLNAYYEELLGLGVINTSVQVNQFREMLETGLSATLFNKKLSFIGYKTQQLAKSKLGDALINKPNELYMGSDDFYKINYFESELATLKEANPNVDIRILKEEAAQLVRNTMPNYDAIPKGLKAMRNLPVGNFVAFPAEILRTSYHIVKQANREILSGNAVLKARGLQRLSGFVGTNAAWFGAAKASQMALGMSEQEVEDYRILTSGPFSDGSNMIYSRDEDGSLFGLNTEFLNSYDYIHVFARTFFNEIASGNLKGEELERKLINAGTQGFKEMLLPFIQTSIAFSTFQSMFESGLSTDGRDSQGRQIRSQKDGDSIINPLGFDYKRIGMNMAKTFLPQTFLSLDKLYKAEQNIPGYDVQYKDANAEWLSQLGLRWDLKDPERGFESLLHNYKLLKKRNQKDRLTHAASTDELVQDFLNTNSAAYQNQADINIATQSALRLLGFDRTLKILKENGFSSEKALSLMSEEFEPERELNYYESRSLDVMDKFKTDKERADFYSNLSEAQRRIYYINDVLKNSNLSLTEAESFRAAKERLSKAKGGEVNVPNAPVEPDERINKLTGLPYTETAGPAFQDNEDEADPLKRLGFGAGGRVKKNKGGTEKYDIKKILDNKVASLVGISKENLDWAKSLRYKYPGALDGQGDAAGHLALGYITSLTKNPSLALKAANAREITDPVGREMDVFNNNLGSKIKAKNLKEAEAVIDDYIKNKTAMYMTQTESEQARGY